MKRIQTILAHRPEARLRYASRAYAFLALATVLLGASLGCYDRETGDTEIYGIANFKLPVVKEKGAHTFVVFTEMHYSPAHRIQEGPRLLPAEGSVPFRSTVELSYSSLDEYRPLEPSYGLLNTYDEAASRTLFSTNCAVCHGSDLKGNGPFSAFITRGPLPANLSGDPTRNSTDGELFAFVTEGGRQGFALVEAGRETKSPMPPFGKLLTEEQRWHLVIFLRSQIGPPQTHSIDNMAVTRPLATKVNGIAVSTAVEGSTALSLSGPAPRADRHERR